MDPIVLPALAIAGGLVMRKLFGRGGGSGGGGGGSRYPTSFGPTGHSASSGFNDAHRIQTQYSPTSPTSPNYGGRP